MDIKDLLKNVKELPSFQLERRLNKLVRENYRYRNLGAKNKKLLLGHIKTYIAKIKNGYGITSETVRRDILKLRGKREKLGLTYEDMKDFKEILSMFKK